MITAYCTASESDALLPAVGGTYFDNATTPERDALLKWFLFDDSDKNVYLSWGRYWIDSIWNCDKYDDTNASDDLKFANALAGHRAFLDEQEGVALFHKTPAIKTTSLVLSSVSMSVTYQNNNSIMNPTMQKIEILLAGDCIRISSLGMVNLVRN